MLLFGHDQFGSRKEQTKQASETSIDVLFTRSWENNINLALVAALAASARHFESATFSSGMALVWLSDGS